MNPELERFEAFLESVVDREEAWGLERDDGWVRFSLGQAPHAPDPASAAAASHDRLAAANSASLTGAKAPVFPLWPFQEQAALAAAGEEEQPRRLSLEDLMEFVLPELSRQGVDLALHPEKGSAYILSARALSERLAEAWEGAD